MNKIFVSYDKAEKKQAKTLVSKLESNGIKCWIAPRDVQSLDSKEEIEQAIQESDIFLLLLSETSEQSIEVSKQLEKAQEVGLHVIPFKTSKLPKTLSMSYMLNSLEWVDAFEDGFDEAYDVLLEIISELSGEVKVKTNQTGISNKQNAETPVANKNMLIIGLVVAVLIIGGFMYFKYSGDSTGDDIENVGEETVLNSEDAVVGSWRVFDYEDSRVKSPEEEKVNKQNVEFLKKNVLIVFNADNSFERYGYTTNVQKGNWEYSPTEKKIFLIPLGINKKEEMNIVKLTSKFMTMIVVENIKDEVSGKTEKVTTKITFQKQK